MDNILVLGAGSLQVPLIETIQSRGYNPVVVSLHDDEPGMQMVKDRVIGDFCKEQEMLQVAKDWKVCAVVTDQTDLPVRTIAYVNDSLGFPSIGYKTACLFTDKFMMREKCKEIGVKTVSYALVNNLNEAMVFFRSNGHSAILKPINNQGSKGVYKICSEEELKDKYPKAAKYSRGEPILIEEFITGPELVIEALALNGAIINLVCGDTHYFDMEDVFAARERVFPSNLDPQIVNQALELNKTIVKGFGFKQGITHGEYIVDGDTVYLIEIAARGGGVYISSDIIPLMTGLKTTDFIVDIAVKKNVPLPIVKQQDKVSCYIAFFLPGGEITKINGVDNVTTLPYVHHNNLDALYVGKKVGHNIDKTSRYFMILEASSREELNDRIDNIHNLLSVEIDSAEGKKGIVWA